MNNKNAKIHKPNQDGQLMLFLGSEAVEDLIFEFLKDRSPLTSAQFNLPRAVRNKLLFEEIRRVHIVKYKKYLEDVQGLLEMF